MKKLLAVLTICLGTIPLMAQEIKGEALEVSPKTSFLSNTFHNLSRLADFAIHNPVKTMVLFGILSTMGAHAEDTPLPPELTLPECTACYCPVNQVMIDILNRTQSRLTDEQYVESICSQACYRGFGLTKGIGYPLKTTREAAWARNGAYGGTVETPITGCKYPPYR